MSTATFPRQRDITASAPLRTGIAFAVTVAVFYTLCTLVWLAVPAQFLGFMNSLFHGIDFSSLVHPGGFAWGGFVEALSVMFVWTLLAGTFFGWLRQLLAR
jgi:hypothetical protein